MLANLISHPQADVPVADPRIRDIALGRSPGGENHLPQPDPSRVDGGTGPDEVSHNLFSDLW